MKIMLIVAAALFALALIFFSLAVQFFRSWRDTNKKLEAANREIDALTKSVENYKARQEIANDEQKKAERDKESLHIGTAGDQFNAVNDILRKRQD